MIGPVLRRLASTSPDTPVGRLLRTPLALVPDGTVVRIPTGELRGMRWVVGAGTFGCALGTYEHSKQRLFASAVRPGDVVWDVGANVGFYTLLAARLVGPAGRVHAFEPLPRNVERLRRHLALNPGVDAVVHPCAVGALTGTAAFRAGPAGEMGRLHDEGELQVAVTTLDHQVESGEAAPPAVLKIDVEGAEADVLEGARECLRAHRPRLFVALHGAAARDRCFDILAGLGYAVTPIDGLPPERTLEIDARPATT